MMNSKFMVLLVLPLIISSFKIEQFKNVKIQDLKREVDLTTRYLQTKIDFTLKNDGALPLDKFYHIIPIEQKTKLFFIQLNDGFQDIVPKYIVHLDLEHKNNLTVLEFTLSKPILERSSRKFQLIEKYFDRYNLLPKQITLTEDQLILLSDDALMKSVYFSESQQTYYKLRGLKSYEPKEAVERGTYLEFQRYSYLPPLSSIPTTIHCENNGPLVVFSRVKKTIEVSHWGNIAIQEDYIVQNRGANLTGEFGRVVYNKHSTSSGKNALKQLDAHLPFKSWGVYYRDQIGNITTSHAQRGIFQGTKQVLIQLLTRFPILGGWKTDFQLGYNLPTSNNLQVAQADQSIHVLTQEFGYAIKDIMAEVYELEIILPEGTSDIIYELPTTIDETKQLLTFSYLDIYGRPTLYFRKNLISIEKQLHFKIQYKFEQRSIMIEPLMIFLAFIILFLTLIALGRLELTTLKLKQI